ncbi:MAG: glycogen synthase GlgA [Beijerinckiaceae bacterium]|nr:glycogen synthase GlgA [Beijerinckiaceae bacterium]
MFAIASAAAQRKILFVTSEMSDYVQAGGLGEVSAALPRALRGACDVRVLIPGYPQVLAKHAGVEKVANLPAAGDIPACAIGRVARPDGLVVYIVICPELYDRPGTPYVDLLGEPWPDNDIRFARLSLAAADIACGFGESGWEPDNLHLNDWPSALAAGYLAWRGSHVPTLLTIHNLAYQGLFDTARMRSLAIPDSAFDVNGVEFYGKLSFLKAGLFYSSHLTTVSSTYANEITTPEFGCGLHGLLAERSNQGRLTGILNGIDESWGEEADSAGAGAEAWKSGHANQVRKDFDLALTRGPLFAIISRLVHQKGVDLAIETAETIIAHGGQLMVTGQGEPRFEEAVQSLVRRHRGMVGARIGFCAKEARRMFAGSDFLLMPSRFEPCGLSQMYAQKFGALPIAHRTGGLADTIEDGQTGFLFATPTANNLNGAIRRAFDAYTSSRRFTSMRRAAMARSFGWEASARRYDDVYRLAHAG